VKFDRNSITRGERLGCVIGLPHAGRMTANMRYLPASIDK
jgi:hypothetical protein